jgi:hypothetical protein
MGCGSSSNPPVYSQSRRQVNYGAGRGGHGPGGFSSHTVVNGSNGYSAQNGFNGPSGFSSHTVVNGSNGYSAQNGVNGPGGFSGHNGVNSQNGFHGANGVNGNGNFNGMNGGEVFNSGDEIEESVLSKATMAADDAMISRIESANNNIDLQPIDPGAYNPSLIKQRNDAINNRHYRSAIQSLRPGSLQELGESMRALSRNISIIDRHWLIYLWITTNIDYDTAAYFSGKYGDQSAEAVFRLKRGVCSGYGNLYKYLCNYMQINTEIVTGYSKGFGFEDRSDAPSRVDHAWNAVEIDGHWYLVEPTWGAGHITKKKVFERRPDSYYFLPRPNEMIHHHLPELEKWQLLRKPITMKDFMQISHLRPVYFAHQLDLISPRYQTHLTLLPGKSYALVLLRAPPDVHLIADIALNNQKLEGSEFLYYDKSKKVYRCYFSVADIGKYKVTIYAQRGGTDDSVHVGALDFTLDVTQRPRNVVTFPKTWKPFFDYDLEILSPGNTHIIPLHNGPTTAQIRIGAPEGVIFLGQLRDEKQKLVQNGSQIVFDPKKGFWRCNFAPSHDGSFEAMIMAKLDTDPGNYISAVAFVIDARGLPTSVGSFPEIWPLFHNYGLHLESPSDQGKLIWNENSSFSQVLIRAPEQIQMSCQVEYNKRKIENATLAQYDARKNIWQLLFAPERTGPHEFTIYAKEIRNKNAPSQAVVKFNLNVTRLQRPVKFPMMFTQFQAMKCQLFSPIEGILKRGSTVPIHCYVPGAFDVNVIVDSVPLQSMGYSNSILRRDIKVGSKEVIIVAKFSPQSSYDGLVKYKVD